MLRLPPAVNTGIYENEFDVEGWMELSDIPDRRKILRKYHLTCDPDWPRVKKVNLLLTLADQLAIPIEKDQLFYLAGPYTGYEEHGWLEKADKVHFDLWRRGIACISPHRNTGKYEKRGVEDSVFLRGYKNCLWRFSGLILMDGWRESSGTLEELRIAIKINLPVYMYSDLEDERNVRWRLHNFYLQETLYRS